MAKTGAKVALTLAGLVLIGGFFGPGCYRGELGGKSYEGVVDGQRVVLEFSSRWNVHVDSSRVDGGGIGVGMSQVYSQSGDVVTIDGGIPFNDKKTGRLSADRESIDFGDGLVMTRK